MVLTDPHAFGVIAIGSKGRGAGRADPFVPPLMAALLVFQTFAQGFHELVKPAKGVDLGLFFGTKVFFGQLFQPVAGDIDSLENLRGTDVFQTGKTGGKGTVELVDVALVLDHDRAGQDIERLNVIGREASLHAVEKARKFAQGNGNPSIAQFRKEGQEHRVR